MLGVNNQLYLRVGSNITISESTQKTVGTAAVPRNWWIHIAVALDLSEVGVVKETVFPSVDGGSVIKHFFRKFFLSLDKGKTYMQYIATTTQVEAMFSGMI